MSNQATFEWEDLNQEAQQNAYKTWYESGVGYYDRYERELFDILAVELGIAVTTWEYTPNAIKLVLETTEDVPNNIVHDEIIEVSDKILSDDDIENKYYSQFLKNLKEVTLKDKEKNPEPSSTLLIDMTSESIEILAKTAFLENYKDEFSFDNFLEYHAGEFLYNEDGSNLTSVQ